MVTPRHLVVTRATDRSGDDAGGTVDYFYLSAMLLDGNETALDQHGAFEKGTYAQPASITSPKDKEYGYEWTFGGAAATGVRFLYWEEGGYDPVYSTGIAYLPLAT